MVWYHASFLMESLFGARGVFTDPYVGGYQDPPLTYETLRGQHHRPATGGSVPCRLQVPCPRAVIWLTSILSAGRGGAHCLINTVQRVTHRVVWSQCPAASRAVRGHGRARTGTSGLRGAGQGSAGATPSSRHATAHIKRHHTR